MDIDATKTPRTYAAWKKSYDVQELAKLMVELSQQLEAELNTAIVNESIAENKVYMLEKQLKENQERIDQLVLFNNQLSDINVQVSQERDDLNVRIKRLEEALTWYESKVSECNRHGPEGDAARDALAKDLGRKAKDVK